MCILLLKRENEIREVSDHDDNPGRDELETCKRPMLCM
jgi:hypothetical protein